jgi:hypothetical protein
MILESKSLPKVSVPKRCPMDKGGFNRFCRFPSTGEYGETSGAPNAMKKIARRMLTARKVYQFFRNFLIMMRTLSIPSISL